MIAVALPLVIMVLVVAVAAVPSWWRVLCFLMALTDLIRHRHEWEVRVNITTRLQVYSQHMSNLYERNIVLHGISA